MAGNKYSLDSSKTKTISISNDTFWYLYQEEEMIDDINMNEANTVLAEYPNGFYISEDFHIDYDNPNNIVCTITPYVEISNTKWDGENVTTTKKGERIHSLKFKFLSKDKCFIEWSDERQNKLFHTGECNVVYFYNNPWCEIISLHHKQKSYIPLSGNSVKLFK